MKPAIRCRGAAAENSVPSERPAVAPRPNFVPTWHNFPLT